METRNGEGVEIVEARIEHAAALAEFARRLYAERLPTMFLHEHAPTVAEEEAFIRGFEQAPSGCLLLALRGAEVVGMLGFRGHGRAQLRHAGVIGFSVARDVRRKGVGTRLFEALFAWTAKDSLLSRIECDVFSTNEAALALLASAGFSVEGTMRAAVDVEGRKIDNLLLARVWQPGDALVVRRDGGGRR